MAQEKKFYCPVCLEIKTSRKYSALASYAEFEAVLVRNATCHQPNLVCGPCGVKLRHPYEIVLQDGTTRRVVHITSRLLNHATGTHKKAGALVALDPVPKDAYLPYPGLIVPVVDYEKFKAEYGTELSHEYAKGGPKDLGIPTVIFGQYAKASPRSCAHFINCAGGRITAAPNCAWGHKKVDERFVATYPDLDKRAHVLGALYPGIRVTAPNGIQPGEELCVSSYGSSFWRRMQREMSGEVKVTRPVALKVKARALLQSEQRRGMKRARQF